MWQDLGCRGGLCGRGEASDDVRRQPGGCSGDDSAEKGFAVVYPGPLRRLFPRRVEE